MRRIHATPEAAKAAHNLYMKTRYHRLQAAAKRAQAAAGEARRVRASLQTRSTFERRPGELVAELFGAVVRR